MALPDLTGQNIENTYQRVLQTDGTIIYDGTGSIFLPVSASYSVTASYAEYAVSASHEIVKEVSSSYADYAKESGLATSSISASYALTASYALNSPDVFPYTGSAIISGSLVVTGSTEIQYLTASGLNYPAIDGDEKQLITTDGSGNLFFDWADRTNLDVKNTSGTTLALGTPVYISGFQGASIFQISPSFASISSSMPAVGVLSQELAPNEQGHATILGALRGYNTSLYSVNDSLYVGEGILTKDRPTGSALIQKIARVGNSQNNGEITIIGAGRSNDVPNLPPGYAWVGGSTWNAVATPTSSFNEDPFPYTGSAVISGSLDVTGNTAFNSGLEVHSGNSSMYFESGSSIASDDGKIYIESTGGPSNISLNRTDGAQLSLLAGGSFAGFYYPSNKKFGIQPMSNPATATNFPSATSLVLDGVGNVGIGTSSPSTNLDVIGNTRITGNITSLSYITASTYYGDGSNLTGIETDPFPYTGSAIISGSLEVIGDTNITGSINLQNSSTNRINFNNAAAINQPQIRLKDYATGITMKGNDVLALMSNGSGMIGMKKTATTAINFPSNAQVGFSWNTSVENHQPYLYFHRYSGNTIGIGVYGGSSTANTNGRLILQHITASGHISASTYYGDGSNLTNIPSDFPYTGSAVISGSLSLEGSGSTIFDVVGSQGQLFSITDSLSGSLFAVSDISGLPILEVFSDDTVKMGSFNNEALEISGSDVNFNNLPTSDPGISGRLFQTGSDAIGATAGTQLVCISQG